MIPPCSLKMKFEINSCNDEYVFFFQAISVDLNHALLEMYIFLAIASKNVFKAVLHENGNPCLTQYYRYFSILDNGGLFNCYE